MIKRCTYVREDGKSRAITRNDLIFMRGKDEKCQQIWWGGPSDGNMSGGVAMRERGKDDEAQFGSEMVLKDEMRKEEFCRSFKDEDERWRCVCVSDVGQLLYLSSCGSYGPAAAKPPGSLVVCPAGAGTASDLWPEHRVTACDSGFIRRREMDAGTLIIIK